MYKKNIHFFSDYIKVADAKKKTHGYIIIVYFIFYNINSCEVHALL